ncbi:hypothetical protein EPH95_09050 [Salicibibacter halophilus]|uniref:Uncharacterized protein n=1 Tax=Salicibibacter halophilus TaxID=2502791 RepID=A0A514LHJ5_9BACI|nr:hypothetical protein [Salicibibacter halophilus]QDI91309.1 hypothetical protein EPH95_09050 [Salicibibacter halophilus]
MKLLPFENTWPYERIQDDIYFEECPNCDAENVLTYMKKKQLEDAFDGVKTDIIMPCCQYKITIAEADNDYFWATERLRK